MLYFNLKSDPIDDLGIGNSIKLWLKQCGCEGCEIKKGSTDPEIKEESTDSFIIMGDVDLTNGKFKKPDKKLPKFEVKGNFWIDGNNLKSLNGYCPIKVSGSFSCTNNPLNDLEGLPKRENVKGNMWII